MSIISLSEYFSGIKAVSAGVIIIEVSGNSSICGYPGSSSILFTPKWYRQEIVSYVIFTVTLNSTALVPSGNFLRNSSLSFVIVKSHITTFLFFKNLSSKNSQALVDIR